jgi:hypothetical protein
LEDRCLLATFNWVLPVDGDFNTSANWINTSTNLPGVPGPSDDAVISNGTITVTSAISNTVNSLTCSANLSITNGKFEIGNLTKNSSITTLTLGSGAMLQADSGTVAISGGTSAGTMASITGATISFVGSTFTMNAGSSLTDVGRFLVAGGTLTFNVNQNAPANLEIDSGMVNGPATLTVTSMLTWNGGSLDGSGTTSVPMGTTLTISGGNNKFVTGGHTLNIAGTAVWTGSGELDGSPGATINNSGAFTTGSDAVCGSGGAGGGLVFNNSGTFTKSVTTGATSFQGNPFNNSGTVNINSGTLTLAGGGTSSGSFNVVSGSIVSFASTNSGGYVLASGAALNGAGLYSVLNAFDTLTINADVTAQNFELDSGTVTSASATLTVTNAFTWSGGILTGAGVTTVAAGAVATISSNFAKFLTANHVLNLAGTTTWTGTGELDGSPGATINNSGLFTAQNDGISGSGGSGAGVIFNNSGTFTKNGTPGTTIFQGNVFNNSGTANINSGMLTLGGGGSSSGTFNVAAGSIVNFDSSGAGGYILGGATLGGAGLYRVPNSFDSLQLNSNLSLQNFEVDGGIVTELATLVVTNNFTWTGGTVTGTGSLSIAPSATLIITGANTKTLDTGNLNNGGSAAWTGTGSLNLTNGAVFTNLGGGAFNVSNDQALGGTGTFVNAGTLNKTGAVPGATAVQGVFNNSGTVNVQSGTLAFANAYTQTAGSTIVSAGATLASSGAVNIQAGLLNGLGTVQADVNNAGTVGTGASTGTLTITRTFTQSATGTLNIKIASSSQFDTVAVGGVATLGGTLNVSLVNSFTPTVGLSFKVLPFASVNGDFMTISGLSINPTLSFSPIFNSADLTLVVGTPGPASAGTLQFSAATYTANDSSGMATVTVTRNNGSQGSVTVTYATSDGSAVAGVSYAAASGTLVFADGVTIQTLRIAILSGAIGRGNQTVNLSITTPTGGATLGIPTTAVLTLMDDSQPIQAGQLQFATAAYTGVVTVGSAIITVSRTNGSSGTVTVQYATSDGTAQAGVRYTATSGTLTFADGVISQSFTIPILNTSTVSGNQTVNLSLSNVAGGATLGTPVSAVLTIVDNSISDDVLFVSGLYHDVLGRAADPGGLNGFQLNVDAGRNQVLAQFAFAYVTSTENRSNFVLSDYSKYLGRTPSGPEVSGWVTALAQGQTSEQVIAAFVSSAEYFVRQGSNNSSWLDHAYQDLLGRPRDPGSQGFLDQLNSGVPRTIVASQLLASIEYHSNRISDVYTTYLQRQPGPADVLAWLPVLGQPSAGAGQPKPDEQFLAGVIGSVEYFQTSGNTELDWTTSLYTKLLGRTPNQTELTNVLVAVLNGFSARRQADATAIAASVEAEAAAVAGYYMQFLGRAALPSEVSPWVNLLQSGGSREQVIAAIVSSDEYFQKQGGTNTQFVDQLYLDLLGRPRDPNDAGFVSGLAGGTLTSLRVAQAILGSAEYAQHLVSQFYGSLLGRQGSTSELNGWAQLLLQGARDEQIMAMIVSSGEYFERPHSYP